jgi:hypothetical protein
MTERLTRDVLVAAFLAAVFTALQIQASLNVGALSRPPTYDDVGYFVDGAQRVQQFWKGGLIALVRGYIVAPPHAPGSSFLALGGFALFGLREWAADAATVIPLFIFTLAILRLMAGLPLAIASAATVALLSIPIFALAIVEFRPDMLCAGYAVLGTLLIVLRDPLELRTAGLIGLVFAATLLMKPTFAPLVGILYGVAFTLKVLPTLRDRKAFFRAFSRGLCIVGIALVVAGPHYVLALPQLIGYYKENVFGANAAVWRLNLPKTELALFYLTGPGGRPSLGPWLAAGLLCAGAPLALLAMKRREAAWQASIILIVAMIAYVVVTIGTIKSAFVGSIFTAYVAAAIILVVACTLLELFQRGHRVAAYAFSAALLVFGLSVHRFPWLLGAAFPPQVTASSSAINDQIISILAADPALSQKTVMFAHFDTYANPEALTFSLMQRGIPAPTMVNNVYSGEMDKQMALLSQSQYVITVTPEYPTRISWLPITKISVELNNMLGPQTGFELVKAIVPPNGSGELRIYKRTP